MSDAFAIQQVLNLYSEGASRRDWDQVMSTFAEDGIWEVPRRDLLLQGHGPIRAAMQGFVAAMDFFVQLNTPAIIEVDGDRATARSTIRECGKYSDGDEALEVLGHYADQLVRTDAGWKFARRTFTAFGAQSFGLLPEARLP